MNTPNRIIRARWMGAITIVVLAALALAPGRAFAQATPNPPGQISYQGYVTDANGVPLATNAPANYDIFFHIYDAPQGGNILWGELQTVTINNGYFSVLLGQGTTAGDGSPWMANLTPLFSGPTASDRYVGITLRGLQEIQPRLRLLSSPYSLLSENSIGLVGNTGIQVLNASGTNLAVNGASGNNSLDIHGAEGIFGNGFLQFGEGINGQDPNAGEIGYELLSPNALDIVGAGPTGNRKIKLWAEGGTSTTGALGVGTDTPASMLHVTHSGDTEISVQSSDSGGHRWTMQSSGSGSPTLVGALQFVDRTVGASRMTIQTSGNVGIGTTTPGTTLEVNGNSYLDGFVSINGNNILDFGRGLAGKGLYSGEIGYGISGGNVLDIYGGGAYPNRSTEIISEGSIILDGPTTVYYGVNAPNLALNTTLNEGVLSIGGVTHLNDNPIYLRSGTDHNHRLVYNDTVQMSLGGVRTVDGAGLFGYQGGALGTTIYASSGGTLATLAWDEYNIYVADAGFSYGWLTYSDRNMKTNFVAVDHRSTLAKVADLPVTEWSYTNRPSLRHIGPMAQDFHAAFGGRDDKTISISDEAGVAISAIKGLNEIVQNQEAEIQTLKQQVQVLQAAVDAMKRTGGAGNTPGNSLNNQ